MFHATILFAAMGFANVAVLEESTQGQPYCRCIDDTSGSYLAILTYGNSWRESASVTVFEYFGNGQPLVKRHEMPLRNKKRPLSAVLSHNGRYFITIDDWEQVGIGPLTLVIYDLAARESTAYAAMDFLSEDQIRGLQPHGFIPGYKWCGLDYEFDKNLTTFVPTRPENCDTEGVPFVVINLATREVGVRNPDRFDSSQLVRRVDREWGWIEESGGGSLPGRLFQWGNGDCDLPFVLEPSEKRYVPSPPR